ncbi:RNA polymerase sigma factor [Robiginitalea sediminis]|uniref:RNA polymerase sigma factor n=1 Tax=Robiginitalea sediminis TaxID=1982593 RepID=UPI000B4AF392|nr:RNA polymerase sigma factor [Robiginitalea sediminis]
MPESEAFESIYREHYPRVRRICLGYAGGNANWAQDMAQEVFIRVWQNLDAFRGESKLSTWIFRIAVNTCLVELRNARRGMKTVGLEGVPVPAPEESDPGKREHPDRIASLYRAIDGLRPTNRTIALLELEGVPQQEIASITGLSHAAVRTRVHRIKNELLKLLKDESL